MALILFAVCGVICLFDFMFCHQELRNLISGIGFALIGFGIYQEWLCQGST